MTKIVCVNKGIKYIKHDLNKKLPYENNFFDLITANQVLEQNFNIDGLLLEIKRLLKSKVYLIVGTPNLFALHERISLLLGYNPSTWHTEKNQIGLRKGKSTNNREHVNGFTIDGLKYFLNYYGFEPIKLFIGRIYIFQTKYIPFLEKIYPSLVLNQCWVCRVRK